MTSLQEIFVHPELTKGEVLFTNAEFSQFEKMNFKTKRLGKIAYDGNGNQLNHEDWFPVFLNNAEVETSELSLMELRRKQK